MGEPTKRCIRCGHDKPQDEWFPSRWEAGNGQWCKECYRDWHRGRYTPKSGANDDPRPCLMCGTTYQPRARRTSQFCSHVCGERYRVKSGHVRRTYLLRKFGITPEQYDVLLAAQGGGCALCGKTASEQKRYRTYLHIDHDHATGLVRGLLCDQCNLLLGRFGDDPDRLIAAANYLRHPPASV